MKRYTRLLSLSLALGLAFILSCEAAFADCVDALSEDAADIVNHWAHEDIAYVIDKGYMTAVASSGTAIDLTSCAVIDASTAALYFEPYAGMSRQMLVTALYSMAQTYEKDDLVLYGVEEGLPFSDITGEEPYYDAVMWAYHEGIVNGIDGRFCPDVLIDRQTMSVMIFRMISVLGVELETDWSLGLEYTDLEDISDWAVDAIAYTNAIGLMSGNPDGSFAPRRELTRAEAAVIIKRLDEKMPECEEAVAGDDSALAATDASADAAESIAFATTDQASAVAIEATGASADAAESIAVTVTTLAPAATESSEHSPSLAIARQLSAPAIAAATDPAASQM